MPRFLLTFLAAWAMAAPAVLRAQVIRGRVLHEASAVPLHASIVSLLDRDSTVIAAVYTDSAGHFAVRLPGRGTFSLRVQRIGYLMYRGAEFRAGGDDVRVDDIQLRPITHRLATLYVRDRPPCTNVPARHDGADQIWEEVRTALAGAIATESEKRVRIVSQRFMRGLDAAGEVVSAITYPEDSSVGKIPFFSAGASVLSRRGYIERVGTQSGYHGPMPPYSCTKVLPTHTVWVSSNLRMPIPPT